MPSFVLSILGDDRSGLVEALSAVVSAHGGNWDKSHMTQLAGKFAGVVLVAVPSGRVDAFLSELEPLEAQGLFDISVEEARGDVETKAPMVVVDVVGNDHPGIVHEVSHLFATRKISIDDLQTWTSVAPMAGGRLFHAKARLRLPAEVSPDDLLSDLEALAADLMVDVHLITEIDEIDAF